jgi:excinuclease ABC subunit A
MSIYKATGFFADYIKISKPLQTLQDVGLGYLKLGQPLSTLSGGELQRLKLCKALTGDDSGNSLYLLDEPTTGLHFEDVNKLLKLLEDLRAKGNTIIVTEHNTDVIKNADFVIDLGPGGGDDGGYLIAETIPEKLKNVQESVTGKYL